MHMIFDMACQKEMTPKKHAHNGGIYRLPRDPLPFLSILQLCLHLHNIGVILQMFDQMHSVGDKSSDEAGYDNILIKRYFF
jgi:hypothetical protein